MLADKLTPFITRYNELSSLLSSPDITSDIKRMTNLSREQSNLLPIVEKAKEYKSKMDAYKEFQAQERAREADAATNAATKTRTRAQTAVRQRPASVQTRAQTRARTNTTLRPLETPTRPITDFNFITYDEVNEKADKLVGNAKIFPKFWKKAYWDSLK